MKKMPTLFVRDRTTGLITRDLNPGCEWVPEGEGIATIKIDGTCCRIDADGVLWKRYDRKPTKAAVRRIRELRESGADARFLDLDARPAPDLFEACQDAPDPMSGHWPGWLTVDASDPQDQWHGEGFERGPAKLMWLDPGTLQMNSETFPGAVRWMQSMGRHRPAGTYELVGPKVQGNPYKLHQHVLCLHGEAKLDVPVDFDGLKSFLEENSMEGIVWWRKDSPDRCKIKSRDFGITWPRQPNSTKGETS